MLVYFEKFLNIEQLFYTIYFTDGPRYYQIYFQDSATKIMEDLVSLHNDIMFFLVMLFVMVFYLLFEVIWLFGTKYNWIKVQRALGLTHHLYLEVAWTLFPMFVVTIIASPSFALIYEMDRVTQPWMTLKIIGHQWYWSYEYGDFKTKDGNQINFDSYMVTTDDLEIGDFRLLEVDNRIILPLGIPIRLLITGADVIHSWTIPSFGIKLDAIPGRLNEIHTFIERAGLFYGQCSEICGVNHSFMPICVESIPFSNFCRWLLDEHEVTWDSLKTLHYKGKNFLSTNIPSILIL